MRTGRCIHLAGIILIVNLYDPLKNKLTFAYLFHLSA